MAGGCLARGGPKAERCEDGTRVVSSTESQIF
jgi:hypothetical protein